MGLKHQAAAARKWRFAIRRVKRHFPPHLPPLLFLTDPQRIEDPIAIAAQLPKGSGVIYRHFGADNRFEIARGLAAICRRQGLFLLIAADPALARHVGADGVHWPEARLAQKRHWRGQFRLTTASAHSRQAISRAAKSGVDAVLVSSVFPSTSPSAGAAMGTTRFNLLARRAALPVYGLGGITADNAGQIAAWAGLSAVAGLACA
ncbi:MAG: thiamine phosphate synthase [Pseudomonadota bacterium]